MLERLRRPTETSQRTTRGEACNMEAAKAFVNVRAQNPAPNALCPESCAQNPAPSAQRPEPSVRRPACAWRLAPPAPNLLFPVVFSPSPCDTPAVC